MSIVTKPNPVIEFLFGAAFAAELAAAPPAPPYRRGTALRPADRREVRSHLGPAAEMSEALAVTDPADFDAPAPPLPSMAEWIEAEAQAVRAKGSELAWWLAERIDEIARECRVLRAETPDQLDARGDVMAEFHGGTR